MTHHVLITGADGFIGRNLAARMLANPRVVPGLERLTLAGLDFDRQYDDPRVEVVAGDLGDNQTIARAVQHAPDLVFHLAAVTSAHAERDFERGLQVNTIATLKVLEALRQQERGATVVFPSTIAVFGPPYPAVVDDDTWPVPALSYGAEKLACEVLIADYTRRGLLQGRVVRLPSIVARPRMRVGAASAFSSEIIRELARGESYVCPVSATATHWLMSLERCLDGLLRAAELPAAAFGPRLVLNLPPVHCTTDDLVRAVAARYGADVRSRVRYEPDARLEAVFGQFPPMRTPCAEAAGLLGDGTVEALVERAIAASIA